MRILLTHQYAWPEVRRGTERYLHELAGALAADGHDVTIRASAPQRSQHVVRGVDVRAWRRRKIADHRLGGISDGVVFAAQALASAVPQRFDVWHANGAVDGAAAAQWSRMRRRGRSVFTDHGFPAAQSRKVRPDRPFHHHVVEHVDEYVCVSQAAARYLEHDYGRTPRVRSGGIDTTVFTPGDVRTEDRVVLFVGDADEERKGVTELVAAQAPGTQTWIAGPGDQRTAVARAGVADPQVRLLGVVGPDDLVELYRRASVTALPARAEAFGLVLVESLACGTPVVALDEGGPREIVTPEVGALAATAGPDDLRRAIEAALDLAADPATVDACRTRSLAWDWQAAVVPEIVAIYQGAA